MVLLCKSVRKLETPQPSWHYLITNTNTIVLKNNWYKTVKIARLPNKAIKNSFPKETNSEYVLLYLCVQRSMKKIQMSLHLRNSTFNTSYMSDSDIVFTLKMESVSTNTIYGLKMIVKTGLETLFWNPSMRENSYFYYWICDFGHFYEVRKNSLPYGGISKIFFLDHFSGSFLGQKLYFWIQIPFWG